jgi:3-deoxy-7-phosphoheptulonate synthase
MIVVMQEGATEDQVQAVIDRMVEMDFIIHRSTGMSHIVLGGVGPEDRVSPADFEEMDGVQECRRIMSPFKLASRHFKPAGSIVRVGASEIGGSRLWICAGLIGASAGRMEKTVSALAALGVSAVRLRTPPRAHDDVLPAARQAATAANVSLIVEVADTSEIALADWYADMLEVPGRSMLQRGLLNQLGRLSKPVLLERSNAAKMEEVLISAEAILAGGNFSVVLGESGIRTFVTAQNTMDLAAIPVAKKYTHLPIVVDPSAGTGRRGMAAAMAKAAVAAGCDGLVLDVQAGGDPGATAQSLPMEQLASLITQLSRLAAAVDRTV